MKTPFTTGAFQPDAAFAAAAARFFELLQSFGTQLAGPAVQPPDWTSLARTLAGQLEQWLKALPAAGASFAAAAGLAPGAYAGPLGAGPLGAGPLGTLPFGPAAAQPQDAPSAWDLLVRLAQLQGQLAVHWSEIANTAAQKFIARVSAQGAGSVTPEGALKLYEMWVNCAEEAYAATVRSDDFCRLQGQLANTGAALLLEQRRHAEALARAWGLPTREEADALQRQIRELREQLQGQGRRAAPARARGARTQPKKPKQAKKTPQGRARRRPGRGRRPRA